MAATRFRAPVVWAYAGLTAVVTLVVAVGTDPAGLADDPLLVMVTLSLLVGLAAITSALTGAELTHRDAAVLDPLTGLLNRTGLEARVAELEQQAGLTGDWVCFVACDLDHFKAVNDTHGHERGDAVLRAVAYELRKALRSFELIYRLGGEEFLVVLPGTDPDGGPRDRRAPARDDRRVAPRWGRADDVGRAQRGPGRGGRAPRPLPQRRRGAVRGQARRPRPGGRRR